MNEEKKNNKDFDKELLKILFNENMNFSTIKDTLDLNVAAIALFTSIGVTAKIRISNFAEVINYQKTAINQNNKSENADIFRGISKAAGLDVLKEIPKNK